MAADRTPLMAGNWKMNLNHLEAIRLVQDLAFRLTDDDLVNAKARAALRHGVAPIVCVGEPLSVRQAGEHLPHVLAQVDGSLAGLSDEQVAGLVVAYEPVWAIGTGEVATPDDAQEVCGAIRARIAQATGEASAEQVRILYGGSVKPDSAPGLMAQPDVDGALVGGASLEAEQFVRIVRYGRAGSSDT